MLTTGPISAITRLKPWQKTAVVGLAYALLVGFMTWPAISTLGQRLIGDNEDAWIFFWNNWWLREALTSDLNLFSTQYLFYPQGTSLVAHSISYFSSFLAFLLGPFFSSVVAYNLVFLFGLWIGAMGMYFLVDDITDHPLASFMAGVVFAFAPYHISQALDHAHLGSIYWWPFFILFLRRTLYGGRWRDAIAAGIFAALTLWTGLQLAVLLALWAALYMVWFMWNHRSEIKSDKGFRNRFLSRSGAVLLVTLLLAMPLLFVLFSNWSTVSGSATAVDEGLYKQTDLLAYLVPPQYNSLWGDLVDPIYDNFVYHRGFKPFIGFTVIGLAAAAAYGWRKKAGFWLLSAGIWVLLAAGPVLRVNGVLFDQLPLPYKWFGSIFPISTIRAPDRFNLLLVLSMAVLVGMGAAYLARLRYWRWTLLPISLFIIVEYLFIPIPSLKLPERYHILEEISKDEATYAVVDYPMGYTLAKHWLYYQTLHGKPTVDGHVSRYTSETYEFLAEQPVLNALYEGGEVARYLPDGFFEEQRTSPIGALGPALRDLQETGVRYILVHRSFASEERLDHFKSILPLAPAYQDDLIEVYDLTQLNLHSFDRYPISLNPDIELVQAISHMSTDGSGLEIELLTRMTGSTAVDIVCHAILDDSSSSVPFTAFSKGVSWREGDLSRVSVHLPIPADILPGQYSWQIECPGAAPVSSPEDLIIEQGVQRLLKEKLQLSYGDLIELEGYRWWYEGGDLHLVLEWLSLAEINQDYKVFVHLLDQSGAIVRQNDYIHCKGECPTGQWAIGQRISDESILPLAGLPEREYRVAFGLYNGDTNQRLETRDSAGRVIPEAYYIISEMITINEDQLIWQK